MSAEIKSKDLKEPSKILKKVLAGLLSGAGGIAQEFTAQMVNPYFGQLPAELSPAVQWLVAGLANGAVENSHISEFLTGISAGSAKDLAKAIYSRFSDKLKLPSLSPQSAQNQKAESPVIPQDYNSGYLI